MDGIIDFLSSITIGEALLGLFAIVVLWRAFASKGGGDSDDGGFWSDMFDGDGGDDGD